MVKFSSKSEVFDFSGWQKPPIRGLTIIKRSWNYGNLPYLVANTYGLNFIKIRGIWIFLGGGWQKPPIRGLHVTCDAHFRTRMSYSSQKSCVKIWFGLVEIGGVNFQGGQKPLLGGVTCDLRCPSSNLAELFQSKVMWKCGSDWLSLSRVIVSTNIQKKKKKKSQTQLKTICFRKFLFGRIIITYCMYTHSVH